MAKNFGSEKAMTGSVSELLHYITLFKKVRKKYKDCHLLRIMAVRHGINSYIIKKKRYQKNYCYVVKICLKKLSVYVNKNKVQIEKENQIKIKVLNLRIYKAYGIIFYANI